MSAAFAAAVAVAGSGGASCSGGGGERPLEWTAGELVLIVVEGVAAAGARVGGFPKGFDTAPAGGGLLLGWRRLVGVLDGDGGGGGGEIPGDIWWEVEIELDAWDVLCCEVVVVEGRDGW